MTWNAEPRTTEKCPSWCRACCRKGCSCRFGGNRGSKDEATGNRVNVKNPQFFRDFIPIPIRTMDNGLRRNLLNFLTSSRDPPARFILHINLSRRETKITCTFSYSYLEKMTAASSLGYFQSLHVGRDFILYSAGGHVGDDKLSAASSNAQGSLITHFGTRSPAAEHRRS